MPDSFDSADEQSFHGEYRLNSVTARVPDQVADGVFANGAIVLCGSHEVVIDFLFRVSNPHRLASRVIMPGQVAQQFLAALKTALEHAEEQFGPIQRLTRQPGANEKEKQKPEKSGEEHKQAGAESSQPPPGGFQGMADAGHSSVESQPQSGPPLGAVYDEVKFTDSQLVGTYANSVLIHQTNTEFCFDFISKIVPRSVVVARIIVATPQVVPIYQSLKQSLDQQQKRLQQSSHDQQNAEDDSSEYGDTEEGYDDPPQE